MTMDLERGYTSVRLQQSGVRGRMHEIPDGEPHAVVRGARDTLCGRVVRARLPWTTVPMEEALCPDCAELAQELESAD